MPSKKGAVESFTIGLAREVAEAILLLLSAETSYTTGAILEVGGGR
jgi:hypothetical protein